MTSKLAKILRESGAQILMQDSLGQCPIASAIAAGQLQSAAMLILNFVHVANQVISSKAVDSYAFVKVSGSWIPNKS